MKLINKSGESFTRTFIKGATWFALRFTFLLTLTYLTTGNVKTSSILTIFFYTAGVIMYIAHERIWNRIPWQRKL